MSFSNDIIITAMDRFVWFVLLVVVSHLVTEFTRVTGYTRGPRHDAVMVNDSSIRPIRVQNLVQYPGQEYGQYAQRNPSYYSGNNQYNNYDNNANNPTGGNLNNNNNANSNGNFFSNMFSGLFNANNNNNNNAGGASNNNNNDYNNNDYNNNYAAGNPQGNANIEGPVQFGVRTVGGMVRPIIDSIFDIPISTLKAVNNLVGRLTGSYQVQQLQQPQQQQQQQQKPQQSYFPSLPSLPSFPFFSSSGAGASQPTPFYGMQKSAGAAEPKSEIEMLKRIRQIDSKSNNNQQQQQQQIRPTVASV